MPANRESYGVHLRQSFLNPIFADVAEARIPGRLYGVRPVRLGNGDDRDSLAVTATRPRGIDPSAYLSKPFREVGKRHNVPIYRRLQSESREATTDVERGASSPFGQPSRRP